MSARRVSGVFVLAAAVIVAVAQVGWRRTDAGPTKADEARPLGPNGIGLTYTPMPEWFEFRKSAEIQRWIDQNDTKAMIEHAWELWGGLTSLTSQEIDGKKYPVFETWVDEFTVFPPAKDLRAPIADATAKAHPFTRARQLDRAGRARRAAATAGAAPPVPPVSPLVVTVKYTKEIDDAVQQNHYTSTAVMNELNQSWDKSRPPTPLRDRTVKPFPDQSIMIKPTYQVVSGTAATLLSYWTGPADSTTPQTPSSSTWTNKMLVLPPGVQPIKVQGVPVVPIDQFYHFELNQQEADFINALNQGTVHAGDYAILVAMHVSSREIDNWTWQTFWWSLEKPELPQPVRHRVSAPFDHYDAAVGYSFTTGPDNPAGLNVVCFNPYLEAGFDTGTFVRPGQLGIESNCMSCHRAAAWPPAQPQPQGINYVANGIIDPGDPGLFAGMTKTDFVWGFALDVAPPSPSNQP
jgi:hypothetical protein